jgi:beta-lactamase superfamily II metal-dependent hydrolase
VQRPSGRLSVVDINNGCELDETTAAELSSAYSGAGLRQLEAAMRGERLGVTRALYEAGYTTPLANPVAFLKQSRNATEIFRYVQTHPDLDHMRGLSALSKEGINIVNFWDTDHTKEVEEFRGDGDREDWEAYVAYRSGKGAAKVLRNHRGATGTFWSAGHASDGGDGIEVLSPTPDLVRAANERGDSNDLSYILRVSYGGIKVILGGDAGEVAWQDAVDHYGAALKCDVLKASHHGRESGYLADAVRLMSPGYTVVSVGKKPETDACNLYRQFSKNVWSTRWRGTITLTVPPAGQATIKGEFDR